MGVRDRSVINYLNPLLDCTIFFFWLDQNLRDAQGIEIHEDFFLSYCLPQKLSCQKGEMPEW
jgi:hypothetical protein